MLTTGERPRELKWYHAGPMLFGDWGTSRLYVLGLAFLFLGHASLWHVLAMCVLMAGVGCAYVTVCRLFPDGGGVYSAAKERSQLLAVVGVLLLCADYVVTASLSCLDAFHYLGIKDMQVWGLPLDAVCAALTILAIGWFNSFGPTKSGTLAMWIAIVTILLTLVIGVFCVWQVRPADIRLASPFARGYWESWKGFTEIVLALSGVEAVANMTGIMVKPVGQTAKKTILPVLVEIVILNLILAAAMNALPEEILSQRTPDGRFQHTGDMLKVIATHYVGPMFAAGSAIVFAALLLSAVNTAVGALVAVQFMLSRDHELPFVLSGLNRAGVPLVPLVVASIIPAVVLLVFPNVEQLADLYAVGVVGAIGINLGSVSTNHALDLRRRERWLMYVLTAIMIAIELTICTVKPHARSFALVVLVIGLAARIATIVTNKTASVSRPARDRYLILAGCSVVAILALGWMGESRYRFGVVEVPLLGARRFGVADAAFLLSAAVGLLIGYASFLVQPYQHAIVEAIHAARTAPSAPSRPKMLQAGAYTPKFRIMVPTQGNPRLIEFALQECKVRQAELQLVFVRLLGVTPMGPAPIPTLEEDEPAKALFDRMREQAAAAGVPLRLLYGVSDDIPYAILDMAVTHGADLLLMGTTRRGALWKFMKGDVIQAVAEQLPEGIGLLIHA